MPEDTDSTVHLPYALSRRDFLFRAGCGFGGLALSTILSAEADAQPPATESRKIPLATCGCYARPGLVVHVEGFAQPGFFQCPVWRDFSKAARGAVSSPIVDGPVRDYSGGPQSKLDATSVLPWPR